ncbi:MULTISPECIES: ABC transporter ATP-binding protein [unclassified Sphingopyxis]|uniref:ABC transporter ATP-binding protein n=1 Tax=unclassified Sphingopyxis TaxID=2614943 RepID=UPI00073707B2|nr:MULTISPECIES: ATP-binding cassette domain-containing protein [unclassified Sphingopyxis]KTE45786.1 ABC transporter ATP-binding protein [Sphingopyxis sp. HIX]KTE85625.1 ABC transporter ATP-binding protein [Sphingopyxis sp. HXXIV]
MTDLAVEALGLTKYFETYKAVDQVSLQVPAGSIYGVLGPNGAGKTTSLRMTLGIIDPDAGSSRLLGGHKPQSVRHRIGYLPEERGLYPGMKAREAIAFMGALRGLDWSEGRRRATTFMTELGLERVIDSKIRKMSKGMAQMIQLIGSIVHAPDLIVLDEPFSGLDPVNQERLEMLVKRERDRGATVLFSTHVMAHAERLCDRLAIIARSQRRFEGTVDDARALLPMQVRYTPRQGSDTAAVAALLPAGAEPKGEAWHFAIEDQDVEPLLARITASGLGVTGLSISRPALHDAFVHIVRQVDAGFTADASEDAIEEASA